MLFYGHYSRFSLFFKWDFNAMEYIQFSCGRSLKKLLMFILFINVPMCQPLSIWTLFVINCHFKCAWKTIIEVMNGNFLFNVMGGWNFCQRLVAVVINTDFFLHSCTYVYDLLLTRFNWVKASMVKCTTKSTCQSTYQLHKK